MPMSVTVGVHDRLFGGTVDQLTPATACTSPVNNTLIVFAGFFAGPIFFQNVEPWKKLPTCLTCSQIRNKTNEAAHECKVHRSTPDLNLNLNKNMVHAC
jgi:hypothetical protein